MDALPYPSHGRETCDGGGFCLSDEGLGRVQGCSYASRCRGEEVNADPNGIVCCHHRSAIAGGCIHIETGGNPPVVPSRDHTRLARTCGELQGYKEPKTALEEMQESSETLLEMFDVQSEIIRNYNGEFKEPFEDVDLSDVVGGLADMFESAAESKGVKLSCDVPSEPIDVRSHRQKLLRLVSNLVDNAVKYTDKGSISVSLERKFPGRVKLTVADTGIGMSKECQKHMFERFYRAERSSSRPGDGNGLAYVDSVVRLYGGSIDCNSALGRGTAITVILPLDMAPRFRWH